MQVEAYIAALKTQMHKRRITYADLSAACDIPLSSLKKAMSRGHISVDRLLKICGALDLDLKQLHELAQKPERRARLTPAQEDYFCNNIKCFRVLSLLLRRTSAAAIQQSLNLSDREYQCNLRELEDIGLLERLPGERLRLQVQGVLQLMDDGPLQAKLETEVAHALIDRYHAPANNMMGPKQLHVGSIVLHQDTLAKAIAKIDEFNEWITSSSVIDRLSYDQTDLVESSYAACVAGVDTIRLHDGVPAPDELN